MIDSVQRSEQSKSFRSVKHGLRVFFFFAAEKNLERINHQTDDACWQWFGGYVYLAMSHDDWSAPCAASIGSYRSVNGDIERGAVWKHWFHAKLYGVVAIMACFMARVTVKVDWKFAVWFWEEFEDLQTSLVHVTHSAVTETICWRTFVTLVPMFPLPPTSCWPNCWRFLPINRQLSAGYQPRHSSNPLVRSRRQRTSSLTFTGSGGVGVHVHFRLCIIGRCTRLRRCTAKVKNINRKKRPQMASVEWAIQGARRVRLNFSGRLFSLLEEV